MYLYYSDVVCILLIEMEISTIVAKISKKKIKKQLIEVEVMSPSTSVVITNITDNKRNADFLSLYFTNSKYSGVSEYDNLEILDDGRVIVHLHDQECKDDQNITTFSIDNKDGS